MTEPAENVVAKLSNIGKYRLIASLGQGGMAKVYLALMAGPAGFNKLLVIKALREDMMSNSEEFVAMFLDEARLAARLNHPNVVQTYEVGEAEGRYFIAMEYLEGQALRTVQRRLTPDGGLPQEEEMRVLAETGRGLHYAHDLKGFDGEPLNVVHRDVSPQNVFLTYDGQVKLLDFGIAKTQDAEHLTKVGVIKGKVDYIAPEQIRGEKIDRRADVFALGAMMWEALSGKRFAGGPKVADVTKIHNRVTGGEPSLAEIAPEVPERLVEICEKAIALDPDERYSTAEDFANDLDAYLASTEYKPSSKTLSELMNPAFENERAKLRTLIDQQIQLVQSRGGVALDGSTSALPRLGPSLTRSGSGVRESSYSGPGSLPDLSSVSTTPSHSTAGYEGQRKRGVPTGVAATLVVAAIGVAVFLATQDDAPAPAPAVPAPTTEGASERAANTDELPQRLMPPPAAAMDTVRVHVEVKPEDAIATLDGARLPRLPFEADLAKDGKLHTLEVNAPGYVRLKQVLTFDRDQHLALELQKRAPAPQRRQRAHRAPEPKPKAEPSADTQQEPAPEPKPKRRVVAPGQDLVGSTPRRTATPKIDIEDPYQ